MIFKCEKYRLKMKENFGYLFFSYILEAIHLCILLFYKFKNYYIILHISFTYLLLQFFFVEKNYFILFITLQSSNITLVVK